MRRIFGLILILGALMMTFTGCGEKDFDGKWDCVEANVDTYGGALSSTYDTIEKNGGVNMLCEIEIDGDDVSYFENLVEYKVSGVSRHGDTMTFIATSSSYVEYKVELELEDDGKTIIATRGNNEYTLARADLINKLLRDVPTWAIVVIVGVIVLGIVLKILAAMSNKRSRQSPSSSQPLRMSYPGPQDQRYYNPNQQQQQYYNPNQQQQQYYNPNQQQQQYYNPNQQQQQYYNPNQQQQQYYDPNQQQQYYDPQNPFQNSGR